MAFEFPITLTDLLRGMAGGVAALPPWMLDLLLLLIVARALCPATPAGERARRRPGRRWRRVR